MISELLALPEPAMQHDVVAQSQFHLSALQHVLLNRPLADQPYHMDIPAGREPASMNLIISAPSEGANGVTWELMYMYPG